MKCRHCGNESAEQFSFCPSCGSPVTDSCDELCVERQETVNTNVASNRILNAFKDNLFLVLCICYTVATALGMFGDGLNILNALISVFLWLVFSESKKNAVQVNLLKNISGAVYAKYIIVKIASVLLAICGVLGGVLIAVFGDKVGEKFVASANLVDAEIVETIFSMSAAVVGLMLAIVCLITAVILFTFNILSTRNIHQFAKSIYKSVESGTLNIVKCKTTHNWLLIFGILSAISTFTNLASFDIAGALSSGGIAVAEIIASVLVKKYFSDCE